MKRAMLLLLVIALSACMTTASAYDAELLKDLPGEWMLPVDIATEAENPRLEDLAFLTLHENGDTSLRCLGMDGNYAFSCEGTWTFEYLSDAMDQLTLWFTSTDDPAQQGTAYDLKCVYDIYMESWVKNDTEITCLIFEPNTCSGISPFEALYDFDDPAFYRKFGPNMRIVNCKDFVSLREKRSTSSRRLVKVPLGALVLAYPQYGDENGFISCVYHDEYGYILAEYLEPVSAKDAGDEPVSEVQQMLANPLYCNWEGENEWGAVFCYRHLEEGMVATQLKETDPSRALEQMLTQRLCDLWERDILAMYDEWEASLPEKDWHIAQEQKQIFETALTENRQEWKKQESDAALLNAATWLEAQGIDLCFDLHGMEHNE